MITRRGAGVGSGVLISSLTTVEEVVSTFNGEGV